MVVSKKSAGSRYCDETNTTRNREKDRVKQSAIRALQGAHGRFQVAGSRFLRLDIGCRRGYKLSGRTCAATRVPLDFRLSSTGHTTALVEPSPEHRGQCGQCTVGSLENTAEPWQSCVVLWLGACLLSGTTESAPESSTKHQQTRRVCPGRRGTSGTWPGTKLVPV